MQLFLSMTYHRLQWYWSIENTEGNVVEDATAGFTAANAAAADGIAALLRLKAAQRVPCARMEQNV